MAEIKELFNMSEERYELWNIVKRIRLSKDGDAGN